jgi:hypothetical protein
VTTNPKAKVVRAVAFINGSTAVAGDVADVKAALGRSTTANSIDPALAAEVNTLSTNNDAWIASSVGPPGRKLQALQAIQSFEGGVMFGANVAGTGQAVANSPQTMWQYTDGVQGPPPYDVAGVGRCDRDKFNGTEADLAMFWQGRPPANIS